MRNAHRREFLKNAALAGGAVGLVRGANADDAPAPTSPPRPNRIGVSTYSFWQFRGRTPEIADCIDQAAAMGFDGVEILHVMMTDESNAALQKIKRRAHSLGLALMGFSTHQGFVSPKEDVRRDNVQK